MHDHSLTYTLTPSLSQVILQDLKLLGVKPDMFTHTSDHFDTLLELAQKLIDSGAAFVDPSPAEDMSALRMKKQVWDPRVRGVNSTTNPN